MLVAFAPMSAQATISIYPYALDFDANSNKRIVSIRVANTSNEPKTFRVSVVEQQQRLDGGFDAVPDGQPMNYSAKSYVTFSPRQFMLDPKESQTVNVSRKPVGDLPDGDYVTHLKIQEISTPKPMEPSKKPVQGMDVNIKLLYSLVVPIYLKKGEAVGTAEVVSAKLTNNVKKEAEVSVRLKKEGEKYFRGRLEVLSNGDLVGMVKNVRIYPNVYERDASIPLIKGTPNLSGKEVKVQYIDESDKVVSERKFRL